MILSKELPNADFKPPKLPFGWLATTFIAPILVIVIPNIFQSGEISLVVRIIVALVLLSVLLFISCIMLTLKLYSHAYTQQIIRFQHDELTKDLNELKRFYTGEQENLTNEVAKLEQRIEEMTIAQNEFIQQHNNELDAIEKTSIGMTEKVNETIQKVKLAWKEETPEQDKQP